jgi:isopenicillin-N epimerase
MLSPKGASFLYAHPNVQTWLEPLVVSWGYHPDPGFGSGNQFIDYHEWQGTRDLAAFLAVPAAIDFMAEHQWEQVRETCHRMAVETRRKIDQLTAMDTICGEGYIGQMFTACIPEGVNPNLQQQLYEARHIEVPILAWNNKPFIRVSIQAYNTSEDVDQLIEALEELVLT